MQLEELIYKLNPHLLEKTIQHTIPNFHITEKPYGIPEYVSHMDKSTVDPYPDAQSIDNLMYNHYRMQNMKINLNDESDILTDLIERRRKTKLLAVNTLIKNERTDDRMNLPRESTHYDHIISKLYDDAVTKMKKDEETAAEMHDLMKKNKKTITKRK